MFRQTHETLWNKYQLLLGKSLHLNLISAENPPPKLLKHGQHLTGHFLGFSTLLKQ